VACLKLIHCRCCRNPFPRQTAQHRASARNKPYQIDSSAAIRAIRIQALQPPRTHRHGMAQGRAHLLTAELT